MGDRSKRASRASFLVAVMSLSFLISLFLAPARAQATESCSAQKPQLTTPAAEPYWASLSDYHNRLLSVDFTFSSASAKAFGVKIIEVVNTNEAILETVIPQDLGDINAGSNVEATLKYRVPAHTPTFTTYLITSALDNCGNSFFYPQPLPEATRYNMTTSDNGRGRVTVNVNWDPQYDTDGDAVATVKYGLYPDYPWIGEQPEPVTAGTLPHTGQTDSLTIDNLRPGRYYDFSVEVSDDDGVEGIQPRKETGKYLRDDRLTMTNLFSNPHPGFFDEVAVRDYYNGGLYWYSAQSQWQYGYSYEYLFRDGFNTEYSIIRGKTAWQGVVDRPNHKVFLAGELPDPGNNDQYAAAIGIINEDEPGLIVRLIPHTDDCNELIGVTMDPSGNRLLAGERISGTPLRNSYWPNGGGLWSIPLGSIDQPATYTRPYQDPLNRQWDKLAVFNGRLYAILHNGGYGTLMSAALADVPAAGGQMPESAWTTEATGVFNMIVSNYHGLVVAQERAGHYVTLLINDGTGWRAVESNYSFAGQGLYELPDHRFLVLRDNDGHSHHVGVAGINGEWEYLGIYSGGWPSHDPATDGNDIYYGTVSPGKVWKVSWSP